MDIQTSNPHDIDARIERSYPESYRRLYPHVQQIVDSISDDGMYNMTAEDIDGMAVEAMARSGMHGDPSLVHNKDIAQVIVARTLFDRHRRRRRHGRRFPLWPFLFLPIDSRGGFHGGFHGGFDGFHGGFHDRDFDGFRDRDFDGFRDRDFDRDFDGFGHRDRDGFRHWY